MNRSSRRFNCVALHCASRAERFFDPGMMRTGVHTQACVASDAMRENARTVSGRARCDCIGETRKRGLKAEVFANTMAIEQGVERRSAFDIRSIGRRCPY